MLVEKVKLHAYVVLSFILNYLKCSNKTDPVFKNQYAVRSYMHILFPAYRSTLEAT